ncbi:MAG: hypothetical protein Q9170_001380 [Blastenia crenularia]
METWPTARQTGYWIWDKHEEVKKPESVFVEYCPGKDGRYWDVAWRIIKDKIPNGEKGSTGTDGSGDPTGNSPTSSLPNFALGDSKVARGLFQVPLALLLMVLDRLTFEHFIYFSNQQYHTPYNKDSVDPVKSPFGISLQWISDVLTELENGTPTSSSMGKVQLNQARRMFDKLRTRIEDNKDIYDGAMTDVPAVSVDIENIQRILDDFMTIQQHSLAIQSAVAQDNADRDTIRSTMKVMQVKLTDALSKRLQQTTQLDDLKNRLDGLSETVKSDVSFLSGKLALMNDVIKTKVNCDASAILEAVSMCAMFANPESGTVFALGSLGSIAGGGYDSVADSFFALKTESGGKVDKKFLYKKLAYISGDIPAMTDQLRQRYSSAKQAQASKQIQDYSASFRIASDKFDSLADHYLDDISVTDDIRKGFKNVVQRIQQFSDLLDEYNKAFLSLANLELDIAGFQETFNAAQANSGPSGNEEIVFVNSVLLQAKSEMGVIAMQELYQASRAVNCLSLQATSVYEPLIKLQSFAALNAVLLKDCFTTWLRDKDIETMKNHLAKFPRQITMDEKPKVSIIDDTIYKSILDDLRSPRKRCTFKFSDRLAYAFGSFERSEWNIRLRSIEVYLPGVIDKRKGAPSVEVGLKTSGKSYFSDEKGQFHEFTLPSKVQNFTYHYKSNPIVKEGGEVIDGVEGLNPSTKPAEADMGTLTIDEAHLLSYAMESPFTTWTISVPQEEIDTSKCQRIEFRFHVEWRGRTV